MFKLNAIQKERLDILKESDRNLRIRWELKKNTIAYMRGNLSDIFKIDDLKEKPFSIAKQFLQSNKELFGNLDMKSDLIEGKKHVDRIGMTHVSFQQSYKDIQVIGGSIRVNFSNQGQITSITSKLVPNLNLSIKAQISDAEGEKVALTHAGKGASTIADIKPQIVIFPHNEKYFLCWKVILDAQAQKEPAEWIYFIDAMKGEFIFRYNDLRNAGPTTGQGDGYYSGAVTINTHDLGSNRYQLRDTTRTSWGGPEIITNDEDGASPSEDPDNNWDDSTSNPRDQNQGPEVDTHHYVGNAVDYYQNIHGRNSYDDTGRNVESDVHFLTDHNNAYWSGTYQKLLIGDGDNSYFDYLSAYDVIAHELTHAVNDACFNPLYYGESGAIDECFADCFAAFMTGDWTIGEEVWDPANTSTAQCLRNIADPTNGGSYDPTDPIGSMNAGNCPDHYNDRYIGTSDYGGVHVNTTIISHAIYLMVEGGTHRTSNVTVQRIGQAATESLLYNAQSAQLNGNTTPDFLEFREAMINACLDLFPDDLEILASVKAAFKAVGVGPDLYLRDTTSDTGIEPNPNGVSCWSPDIIVRNNIPANPQTEFMDPSRNDLSENIEFGQDNYIFLRITNGGNHADDVDAEVYFCPVSTFPDPSAWQLIGTINEFNVTPSEFRISNHLVFPSAAIPEPGHYCFVCILKSELDPAPDHNLIDNINEFRDFIQYSNNYAWKNTNVVSTSAGTSFTVDFVVQGIQNNRMWANIEIDLRHMPDGTDFEIEIPQLKVIGVNLLEVKRVSPILHRKSYLTEKFYPRLQPFILNKKVISKDKVFKKFRIEPRHIGKFERIKLNPGETIKTKATVTLPKDIKGDRFTFTVKQKVDNKQIGQINYVINVK